MHELPIPVAAMSDASARELARIWAAGGRQHVSMDVGAWDDPAAWGIFLADLARHVANAYQQTEGRDPNQVLARIRDGFDAEWDQPTEAPSGGMVPEA